MSYDDCFDDLAPTATRRYVMPGVRVRSDKEIAFILRFAGEGNPGFISAITREAARSRGRDNDATRVAFIAIFAKHAIVGWENNLGDDGKPVAYSPAECEELLGALLRKNRWLLVKDMFDYATAADNFAGELDAESLGKR